MRGHAPMMAIGLYPRHRMYASLVVACGITACTPPAPVCDPDVVGLDGATSGTFWDVGATVVRAPPPATDGDYHVVPYSGNGQALGLIAAPTAQESEPGVGCYDAAWPNEFTVLTRDGLATSGVLQIGPNGADLQYDVGAEGTVEVNFPRVQGPSIPQPDDAP